jgi:hypothetical protein
MALVCLLWLLVGGCSANEEDAMTTNARTFPVTVTVVQRTDGGGNDGWTYPYIDALLAEATALVGGAVTFEGAFVHTVVEDDQYTLSQRALLALYTGHTTPHMINIVISRPNTEDSAGRSNALYAHTPLLVMRARPGDTVRETALILVHELGHNMGLAHENNPLWYEGLTTDNWHEQEAGRKLLRVYRDAVVLVR